MKKNITQILMVLVLLVCINDTNGQSRQQYSCPTNVGGSGSNANGSGQSIFSKIVSLFQNFFGSSGETTGNESSGYDPSDPFYAYIQGPDPLPEEIDVQTGNEDIFSDQTDWVPADNPYGSEYGASSINNCPMMFKLNAYGSYSLVEDCTAQCVQIHTIITSHEYDSTTNTTAATDIETTDAIVCSSADGSQSTEEKPRKKYYITINSDPTRYYKGDTIKIARKNDLARLEVHEDNNNLAAEDYAKWWRGDTLKCQTQAFCWFDISNSGTTLIKVLKEGSDLTTKNFLTVYERTDTLKPTPIPCDSNAIKMDTLLTGILNSMDSKPEMQNLRDSSPIRKFEVGFTIRRTVPSGSPVYLVEGYNKDGVGQHVVLITSGTSKATVHSHPPVDSAGVLLVDGPSPKDMYNAIGDWNDFAQRNFLAGYIISGEIEHRNEYAVAVTDTDLVKAFFNLYPMDTSILSMGDSIMRNGIRVRNFQVGNWKGDVADSTSFYWKFVKAFKDFKREGYPKEYLEDYANVYMMQKLNMGTKMYRKVNGQFKELNFYEVTDTDGTKHKRISICQ